MFKAGVLSKDYPDLLSARTQALAIMRRTALHTWSMTHGIADLFTNCNGDGRGLVPVPPEELLEAGLLVHLQSFGASNPRPL